MGEDGGQLRGKQLQGSKKERKKSTKTKGEKVEVMASFGIFLQLAILCFFIKSKVHGKHFLIETKGDGGDGEGGDGEGGDGDSGDYSSGLNRQNADACAVATGDTGTTGNITATAICVCHCSSNGNSGGDELIGGTVTAVAQCRCICDGVEGPFGRCEEKD